MTDVSTQQMLMLKRDQRMFVQNLTAKYPRSQTHRGLYTISITTNLTCSYHSKNVSPINDF